MQGDGENQGDADRRQSARRAGLAGDGVDDEESHHADGHCQAKPCDEVRLAEETEGGERQTAQGKGHQEDCAEGRQGGSQLHPFGQSSDG